MVINRQRQGEGTGMKIGLRAALLCSAGFLAAGHTIPAQAQQAAQPDTAAGSGLQEIVVTARRREERLQSVPIAITALSTEQIRAHDIVEVEGLQHLVPSLAVNTSTTRDAINIYIRGVGPTTSADPAVVTYFADIPLPQPANAEAAGSSGAQPGLFFDLESVQVLKGPQGTLFGKNTTGGALLLAPHQPTNNFEGYGQLTLGDYNRHDFEGVVNVPIVDEKVLLRVGGQVARTDGFTKNLVSGKDMDDVAYETWRVSLTLRPTDDVENKTIYYGLHSHNNGTGEQAIALNTQSVLSTVPGLGPVTNGPISGTVATRQIGPTLPFLEFGSKGQLLGLTFYPNLNQVFREVQALGPREVMNGPLDPVSYYQTWGIINKTRWDITDNFAFHNTASYLIERVRLGGDYAGLPLPYFDNGGPGDIAQWSQYTEEPQFSGKAANDKLDWFTGVYLSFEHPVGPQIGSNCVLCTVDTPLADYSVSSIGETQRSQAVYAQGTYDMSGIAEALDGLKFTGGYRYTWDYRSDYSTRTTTTAGVTTTIHAAGSGAYHSPSWLISGEYHFDPQTMAYLSWRRGYKSGGFNVFTNNPDTFQFKPEIVKVVELGVKSDWEFAGIKGRTNVSAYHNDYTNIQQAFADPSNPNAAVVINAGKAQQDGIELDGQIIPVDGVAISGSYAYEHAKYLQFFDALGNNISTNTFPFIPANKFNLEIRYYLPLDESLGKLSLAADWSYQSHTKFDVNTGYDPLGNIGSYSLYDIRADWKNVWGSPVDASVFVNNLTDTVYRVGGLAVFPAALGFTAAVYNPPRMFGVQLRYTFGPGTEAEQPAPATYVPPPVLAPAPKSYLVFFDFDKSDLTPQAKEIVDTAAKNAQAAKVTRITCTGHTDTVGSDAYNLRLSRRRAESVAAQLEKDGIPSSQIEIVAKGKRDLLVPTGDGVREPQNRRVQIVFDGAAGA
jgi:iron complex outermembrane receptor protein